MKRLFAIPLSMLALLIFNPLSAADIPHGQQLHEQNCVSCHASMTGGDGTTLYTRKDHRVTSLAALDAQVQRCAINLELKWFDDDLADVAAYLNTNYYKFTTE